MRTPIGPSGEVLRQFGVNGLPGVIVAPSDSTLAQIILVDGVPGSGKSVVAQTITRRLHQADIRAYVRGVLEALTPLAPRLIYLRQRDVAATMRRLRSRRTGS